MHIILGCRVEHIEEALLLLVDLEHAGHVPAPITVIRRAPHRAQTVLVEHLEALLAQLVRPQDMTHAVDGEELAHDLRAERVPGAARAERELIALGVRVAPDEVGHGALVWDLAEAVDDLDLVDGVDAGAEAAVHAEDLVGDDDGECQVVEHVGEVVPDLRGAVLARALGVEAVGLGDAS